MRALWTYYEAAVINLNAARVRVKLKEWRCKDGEKTRGNGGEAGI